VTVVMAGGSPERDQNAKITSEKTGAKSGEKKAA